MKKSSKNLIKTLLLSAIASIAHNGNANAETKSVKVLNFDFNENETVKHDVFKHNVFKNVIKIKSNGDVMEVSSHRSHRSHSSHRSSNSGHYSHSSSSNSYRSGNSYSSGVSTPAKTVDTYELGDRTLRRGLYGKDVTTLTGLLVTKHYLNPNSISMRGKHADYDSKVEDAIKNFQNDSGMGIDGVADANVIAKLKNWDESKTTLVLGVRDLSQNDYGDDVNELVALLSKAGYPPDQNKYEYTENGKLKITEDIVMAVKVFQAYNKIRVTGLVNTETIEFLKKAAR